jgi:hypothetical protein
MRIRAAAGQTLRILRRLCGGHHSTHHHVPSVVTPKTESPAADLTSQDVDVLMEAMKGWQNNINPITFAKDVIGCGCDECQPDREAFAAKLRDAEREIRKRFDAELASRNERSIRICAKLISLRDSMIADKFFRESIH